jgi:GNAT superfamily N-acetyltransferase
VPALQALIEASMRGLSAPYYTPDQVSSVLRHLIGPDTQLIADGTYFVVEAGDGRLAAAGGWSRRDTHYGGDHAAVRDDSRVDPAAEPARIRAFFVHPDFARRGLARRLFEHCRAAARAEGFRALTLVATLPGVPLYRALGFAEEERLVVPLPDGLALEAVRMTRGIADEV